MKYIFLILALALTGCSFYSDMRDTAKDSKDAVKNIKIITQAIKDNGEVFKKVSEDVLNTTGALEKATGNIAEISEIVNKDFSNILDGVHDSVENIESTTDSIQRVLGDEGSVKTTMGQLEDAAISITEASQYTKFGAGKLAKLLEEEGALTLAINRLRATAQNTLEITGNIKDTITAEKSKMTTLLSNVESITGNLKLQLPPFERSLENFISHDMPDLTKTTSLAMEKIGNAGQSMKILTTVVIATAILCILFMVWSSFLGYRLTYNVEAQRARYEGMANLRKLSDNLGEKGWDIPGKNVILRANLKRLAPYIMPLLTEVYGGGGELLKEFVSSILAELED